MIKLKSSKIEIVTINEETKKNYTFKAEKEFEYIIVTIFEGSVIMLRLQTKNIEDIETLLNGNEDYKFLADFLSVNLRKISDRIL